MYGQKLVNLAIDRRWVTYQGYQFRDLFEPLDYELENKVHEVDDGIYLLTRSVVSLEQMVHVYVKVATDVLSGFEGTQPAQIWIDKRLHFQFLL